MTVLGLCLLATAGWCGAEPTASPHTGNPEAGAETTPERRDRPAAPARYSRHLAPDRSLAADPSAVHLAAANLGRRPRLVGPAYRLNDLPARMAAGDSAVAPAGPERDDLSSAGRRLVERLHNQKLNAALIAIPPELLLALSADEQPSAAATRAAEDLEQLFQVFDGSGLVLVPELSFAGAVTGAAAGTGDATDMYLADSRGTAGWEQEPPEHAAVRVYNPLSERVQQLLLGRLAAFLDRYAGHPSFGGVAFRLGPSSVLQFPGLEWGYNPEIIDRFTHVSARGAARIGQNRDPAALFTLLTGTLQRDWTRFRSQELAAWHQRLVQRVLSSRAAARVIFSGPQIWRDESPLAEQLTGLVQGGQSPTRLLAEQGLDFSLPVYVGQPHVTVLRPLALPDLPDPLVQGAAVSFNRNQAMQKTYRGVAPGGFLYSTVPPVSAGISWVSRRGPVPGEARVLPDDAPERTGGTHDATGTAAPAAALLGALDAQVVFYAAGGTPLPEPLTESLSMLVRLPAVPFQPSGPQRQPLVVRAAQADNGTWIYVVNPTSLPVQAELTLDCPVTTRLRALTEHILPPLQLVPPARSRLACSLPGYGLWAVRVDRPQVHVTDISVEIADDALAELRSRMEQLQTTLRQAVQAGRRHASTQAAATTPAEVQPVAVPRPPLDRNELRQLTKTVASIKLAWGEGRYGDCQRLVDGYWAELLRTLQLEPPASPPRSADAGGTVRETFHR